MQAPTPPSDPSAEPTRAPKSPPRLAHASEPVQSKDLFKGQKSLVIEHNGATYRLQTTKLGKLILTK